MKVVHHCLNYWLTRVEFHLYVYSEINNAYIHVHVCICYVYMGSGSANMYTPQD